MHKRYRVALAILLFQIDIGAIASELPDTIQKIKTSIVGVGTVQRTRTPPAQLLATGFAVGNGLQVVTNAHVMSKQVDIQNNEKWVVFVGQGLSPEVRDAKLIKTDNVHDLVVLQISGKPLPALKLSDSKSVREGELFAFTGFPIGSVLGLYPSTHMAMISAITPIVIPVNQSSQLSANMINKLRAPFKIFQLDATAYPGNSGSPVYKIESGEVIGVINMVFVKEFKESVLSNPSGISYAIPSIYVTELLGLLN